VFVPTSLRWIANADRAIAFGVPPKNGLHSFWEALRGDDIHRDVNPYKCPRRVFVVRHPVERFKSLWRNKCRDGEQANLGIAGMTPEQLFEHIQTARDNYHWTPQVDLLGGVEAEVVRLEGINDWWAENMGGEFPRLHSTEGDVDISPELLEKIRTRYQADLRLWHGL